MNLPWRVISGLLIPCDASLTCTSSRSSWDCTSLPGRSTEPPYGCQSQSFAWHRFLSFPVNRSRLSEATYIYDTAFWFKDVTWCVIIPPMGSRHGQRQFIPCKASVRRSTPPTWTPRSSTHHFWRRIWSSLYTRERTTSPATSRDPSPGEADTKIITHFMKLLVLQETTGPQSVVTL